VYYDLLKYRDDNEIENVAIARLEQFYPFPDADIADLLSEYSHLDEVIWCQEEPKNMGAWTFVMPRFHEVLPNGMKLTYAGRVASASPATGYKKIHEAEQEKLVKEALGVA
jgi:2-oxoglutarate dehydrogenase E1 component